MDVDTVLITNPQFDFQKKPLVLIEDSIQDTVFYQYNAQSNSNSSLTWNQQIPGYQLTLDNYVQISTYINLTLRLTGVPIGQTCFQYGNTDCIQSFPFNRLIQSANVQFTGVNRPVVSQFILDELIRTMDYEALERMADLTAVKEDEIWGMYNQGINTASNVLASTNNVGYSKFLKPRGASNLVTFLQIDRFNAAGTFQDDSPVSTATTDYWNVSLQIHTVEPFIGLGPFLYEPSPLNKGGLMGLNNINLVCTMDTGCSRIFSTSNTTTNADSLTSFITSIGVGLNPNAGGTPVVNLTTPGITSNGFTNPQLLMTMYTPNSYQLKKWEI
jgi:hypothetical protein